MTNNTGNTKPTALAEMPHAKYSDSVLAEWVRFYHAEIRQALQSHGDMVEALEKTTKRLKEWRKAHGTDPATETTIWVAENALCNTKRG